MKYTRLALVLPVFLLAVGCSAEVSPEDPESEYGTYSAGTNVDDGAEIDSTAAEVERTLLGVTPVAEVTVERDPHPSPWQGSVSVTGARDPHPSPWNPPKRGSKPEPGTGDPAGSMIDGTTKSTK